MESNVICKLSPVLVHCAVKMKTMIMVTGGNDNNDAMVICKLSRVLVERGHGDNDDNDYDDDNGCPAHSHLSCHASAENFPT